MAHLVEDVVGVVFAELAKQKVRHDGLEDVVISEEVLRQVQYNLYTRTQQGSATAQFLGLLKA